jgi:hypothetical protein
VAFAVLFLRLEEPNAWLLALLFCAFAASAPLLNPLAISSSLRAFAFAFRAVFAGMLAPLFYLFFAVFPLRSHLDRRLPWLKWVGLLFGVCIVLPGLRTGDPSLPRVVAHLVGSRNAVFLNAALNFDLLFLGIISLAQNSFMAAVPAEARRKSRVILWGTVVGILPIALDIRLGRWMSLVSSNRVIHQPFETSGDDSRNPNFRSRNIAGHQFVSPDWNRFSPTKAVSRYQ